MTVHSDMLARLKEIYSEAHEVLEREWSFGEFKDGIEKQHKEAETIFENIQTVLEFYANGDNWEIDFSKTPPVVAVKLDKGHKARAALGRHL